MYWFLKEQSEKLALPIIATFSLSFMNFWFFWKDEGVDWWHFFACLANLNICGTLVGIRKSIKSYKNGGGRW